MTGPRILQLMQYSFMKAFQNFLLVNKKRLHKDSHTFLNIRIQ